MGQTISRSSRNESTATSGMPKISIIPATVHHALDLAPRIRRDDKWEVMCSSGLNSVDALTQSIQFSEMCWTALLDGRPEICWGVCKFPPNPSMGIVWLLSSEEMYKIPGRFVRESHTYVDKMLKVFPTLFNYVYVGNMPSRKWLENMGFAASERIEEYGVGKQPFLLYSRTI